jgi:formylglycine-generating enzyme required for sulfatase activity
MLPSHRRAPSPTGLALALAALAGLALAPGCHHAWDALMPRGEGGAASSATTSAAGGAGTGGATTTTTHDAGAGGAHAERDAGGAGGGAPVDAGDDAGSFLGQGDCPDGLAGPALVRVAVPGGAYCIDATEVTRAQYAAWLAASPSLAGQPAFCAWNPSYLPDAFYPPDAGDADEPVVDVDWCDAFAYCAAAGKHLCGRIGGGAADFASPASAATDEWFDACAGPAHQTYPYGDAYQPAACNGAGVDAGAPAAAGSTKTCEGGLPGLFDMSGNVWEWEDACDGWAGPADRCRVRGGSYTDGEVALSCAVDATSKRTGGGLNTGFRCCADAKAK